jgi:hypothetical protein
VREALDRILASKYFAQAPMKQKFLRLVCNFYLIGRANELNEYLIGREVFGRDDTYNPAADPIVRVAAHDIRKKLELYYGTEGHADDLRLEMPVGSYEPIFVTTRPPKSQAAAEQRTAPSWQSLTALRRPRSLPYLIGGQIATLAVLISLVVSNLGLREELKDATSPSDPGVYGPVWQPFLAAERPTMLVVSNPPVYRFSNAVDPDIVIKKSVGLEPDEAGALAQALKDKFLMKQNRVPRLVLSPEDYTGMGEAIGLHRITDLFRSTRRSVVLKQSRTASPEDLKSHNVILLGSVWVNEWSGKLPVKEDFIYTGSATIENRNPQPGELLECRPEFNADGELMVDYALVTVKPNLSLDDTVMVLAGIHSEGTEAAAEFVTSKNYLNDLNRRLVEAGEPRYYQALLRVEVENGIPTTISLVALHELHLATD